METGLSSCPLCRSASFSSEDCPTCINAQKYWVDANKNISAEIETGDENETLKPVIKFPGPGKILHSPIYGNYVVASKRIEEGELIICERPLIVSPYGYSDKLPFCLACCRDVSLSAKCSKCKWPICGFECEKRRIHAENECPIFQSKNVKPKGQLNEYFSIEALRCLLLRDRSPWKWRRVLEFEAHIPERKEREKAQETLSYILDFIRGQCGLGDQFDETTVDLVVGVLAVNTFWAHKDIHIYASCLFDKVTLFAHSCDPNTNRRMILNLEEADHPDAMEDVFEGTGIRIEIKASRVIEPGEMITIRYVELHLPMQERREDLFEIFYFHCTCHRCLTELAEHDDLADNLKKLALENEALDENINEVSEYIYGAQYF